MGWRVVLGIAKPHKSTVEFNNYPAPGAVLRWMREVPLASTKECRPTSGAFVETPTVMTFGNDLPRRPAIWACAVAVGSGVPVPIMRLEGEFFVIKYVD